jgi:hypothetical protein
MNARSKTFTSLVLLGIIISCGFSVFGFGGKVSMKGNGGNPIPQFCIEPCGAVLTRWFEIEIVAGPTKPLIVKDFVFNAMYHDFQPDLKRMQLPTKKLTTVKWDLIQHISGLPRTYPNGNPNHGMVVGGTFRSFKTPVSGINPPVIPVGDTAIITLQVRVIMPTSRCDSPLFLIPNGFYSISCDIITSYIGIVECSMHPAKTCIVGQTDERVSMITTPKTHIALQAVPIPLHSKAKISFNLVEKSKISLSIYNLQGKKITSLIQDHIFDEGKHETAFELGYLPSGMYLIRLETPKGTETIRIVKE